MELSFPKIVSCLPNFFKFWHKWIKSESDVAKMSDKEFEDRQDEINEAMKSGKFIYDVSGAAR